MDRERSAPIVPKEDFERVQATLAARAPRSTPPRAVNCPTLLTGLARCKTCGAGMTLRTGKGGRYRYYVCAGRAQKGVTACPGQSISMDALDGMVLEALTEQRRACSQGGGSVPPSATPRSAPA